MFILLLSIVAAVITFSNKVPLIGDTRARYGLDIQGGMRVVLRAKKEDYKAGRWGNANLEAVRRILENRVNATGVAEPVILTKPDDQIILELPGLKNKEEALQQLQSTASLQFYLLPQVESQEWIITSKPNEKTGLKDEILVDSKTNLPLTKEQMDLAIFSREPIVTGKDLLPRSKVVTNSQGGKPVIDFEFNAEGSRIFEQITRANINKHLAIFLDKQLVTAPNINGPIPGKGIIEGSFTYQTAQVLADQLNAGALPVPLVIEEVRDIEATLGRESVAQTTTAGIVGLVLVLIFMLVYYRLPGVVADFALILYALFTLSIFKGGLRWFGIEGVTLTLPGIAGFILSIGMAVDANILIFERLKEELRSGKTLRNAIDTGFKRAFTAIFDSNVCTMITCVILYNFGTGPIRGFAMTLGLGVAISMFTAITVTRTFLFALVRMGFAQNPALYGVAKAAKNYEFHFMRKAGMWLAISCAIIVPGFIATLAGGIKPSIDFTGGTELILPFAQRHSAPDVQKVINDIDMKKFKDSRVVVSNEPSGTCRVYITTTRLSDQERVNVVSNLIQKVGPFTNNEKESYANVSGVISSELVKNAILAVLFASVLILLYLALRFSIGGFREGMKYGACALVALLHDVLVLLGAFAILGWLFNWQVDSLFVTAMLTVIGFSVHDTIVVFDRIRENLHRRAKGESFIDLTDRSISQTLARSINTSLTVVITLIALVMLGGSSIKQFNSALLIGILSGTYSSIFNASVMLVLWKKNDVVLGGSTVRSGLVAKSASLMPGDRPLVIPPSASSSTSDEPDAEEEERVKKSGTTRRQPVRRRRM